jgi:predicted nucleic acid-binding protein
MTNVNLVFDSNIIYRLIRELPEEAFDKLSGGSTIILTYYELGNALWRECRLLKRISIDEAEKSLRLMYALLAYVRVGAVDDEKGIEILKIADKFNLTFYDAAYLIEAKENSITLVTDDKKLVNAAENLDVETLSSNMYIER